MPDAPYQIFGFFLIAFAIAGILWGASVVFLFISILSWKSTLGSILFGIPSLAGVIMILDFFTGWSQRIW